MLSDTVTVYLISLLHPIAGLAVLILAILAAVLGWRYRRARLGKSGQDVMGTFHRMQQHKQVGIALAIVTLLVWVGGISIARFLAIDGTIYTYPHQIFSLTLLILLLTSASVMLLFRQRVWASPVHLSLNGVVLVLLAVQLLSGLDLVQQIFY